MCNLMTSKPIAYLPQYKLTILNHNWFLGLYLRYVGKKWQMAGHIRCLVYTDFVGILIA